MASSHGKNTDEVVRRKPEANRISASEISISRDSLPLSGDITRVIESLLSVEPNNVQEIASSQIKILTRYYEVVLSQAEKSFRWAVIAAGVGLFFFLLSLSVLLIGPYHNISLLGVVSGAVVEVISGINFYLYSKTTGQLADFHVRLDSTQRILLANSLCESLSQQRKDDARVEIIRQVAGIQQQDGKSIDKEA